MWAARKLDLYSLSTFAFFSRTQPNHWQGVNQRLWRQLSISDHVSQSPVLSKVPGILPFQRPVTHPEHCPDHRLHHPRPDRFSHGRVLPSFKHSFRQCLEPINSRLHEFLKGCGFWGLNSIKGGFRWNCVKMSHFPTEGGYLISLYEILRAGSNRQSNSFFNLTTFDSTLTIQKLRSLFYWFINFVFAPVGLEHIGI